MRLAKFFDNKTLPTHSLSLSILAEALPAIPKEDLRGPNGRIGLDCSYYAIYTWSVNWVVPRGSSLEGGGSSQRRNES
jgi:hypothetical protein